mmetsp:Transcript_23129/g.22288  ORF Transcript_23129/g.22288 Transcript_23129/m.22288 type:complete len:97 (+) Transcript_23129:684-974(+)
MEEEEAGGILKETGAEEVGGIPKETGAGTELKLDLPKLNPVSPVLAGTAEVPLVGKLNPVNDDVELGNVNPENDVGAFEGAMRGTVGAESNTKSLF